MIVVMPCRHNHELRHTLATLQLWASVHFMQLSKQLGHSTFTLTLLPFLGGSSFSPAI